MDYSALDDVTLIGLIGHAHDGARNVLYERYHRLVFSLALHIVSDRSTAEEIVLDVFVSIWEKADTYRPGQAKVSTWLTSITRHRAIDVLRRTSVRPDSRGLSWDELSPDAVPGTEGPVGGIELALQQQRVGAAVAGLSAEQKEAIELAYFQGYAHQQIAQILALPLGTVKTRIRLAMQKLRDLLHEEAGG